MNQSHPRWTEADESASRSVRLPGARTLLDSAALSELLGQQATISRVRIKPGHSVVAAFTTAEAGHGWAMLTLDPDKLRKARHRAEQDARSGPGAAPGGLRFALHAQQRPFLFSGSLWADPVLAKDLRSARNALNQEPGAEQAWKILRHNPRRRVVAVVPSAAGWRGEKVLRVASRGTTATALETARRWRDLGLPLVRSTPVGSRGTALWAPLWGWADLSSQPHGPAAVAAGEALGTLHQLTSESRRAPRATGSGSAAAAIALIAPWLGARADTLARRIEDRFSRLGPSRTTELHGDLSPDQVVLAAPGSHKIRLIDLDRATTGDPMRDLGSWAAACRRLHREALIEDFWTGYLTRGSLDQARAAAWEAHAQLHAAPDPFRVREPDWPDLMHRTLSLGEEALHR
ncbi:phosphotransferase family protein [Nesterenkonia aurantiaca]|uniref:phosphotransferase family protein n=1 Tax=Nesterenkonia aurantiaca TaxID=1436010 RepID=UPI003EE65BD8